MHKATVTAFCESCVWSRQSKPKPGSERTLGTTDSAAGRRFVFAWIRLGFFLSLLARQKRKEWPGIFIAKASLQSRAGGRTIKEQEEGAGRKERDARRIGEDLAAGGPWLAERNRRCPPEAVRGDAHGRAQEESHAPGGRRREGAARGVARDELFSRDRVPRACSVIGAFRELSCNLSVAGLLPPLPYIPRRGGGQVINLLQTGCMQSLRYVAVAWEDAYCLVCLGRSQESRLAGGECLRVVDRFRCCSARARSSIGAVPHSTHPPTPCNAASCALLFARRGRLAGSFVSLPKRKRFASLLSFSFHFPPASHGTSASLSCPGSRIRISHVVRITWERFAEAFLVSVLASPPRPGRISPQTTL